MVLRFQIHKFAILIGLILCIIGIYSSIGTAHTEALRPGVSRPPTMIIDPGHGGEDGGAVAVDGTKESQINLDIALKLNQLSNLCGVPNVLTRDREELQYPADAETIAQRKAADQNARLRLIRDYPHGILISIHQNTYPQERVNGVQVLYGHSEESQILGTVLQEHMNLIPDVRKHRSAAEIPSDIYLLKHCECTAVLIECGFISNHNECKLLQTDTYQKKLATVILGTYLQQYSK